MKFILIEMKIISRNDILDSGQPFRSVILQYNNSTLPVRNLQTRNNEGNPYSDWCIS